MVETPTNNFKNFKDFKYCIWCIPERNHHWYSYTDGFDPHITLRTHLEKEEATDIINNIQAHEIKVKIIGNIKQSHDNNFYALFYNVKLLDTTPKWWPNNAHVSFKYRYNSPFSIKEINDLQEQITVKSALLNLTNHYCPSIRFSFSDVVQYINFP